MIAERAARRVRLVGFDVDGVMTDGVLYLGAVGAGRVELKRFDSQDGVGIAMLRRAGIRVAIITGRVSESVAHRAAELEIDALVQDRQAHKLPAMLKVLRRYKLDPGDAAFVGDDLPDLDVMRAVGLPVAVRNATPEVMEAAHVHLEREGGRGAVREFAELLLKARGEWDTLVEGYLAERRGTLVSERSGTRRTGSPRRRIRRSTP